MNHKEMQRWLKKEIRPAYKQLKTAIREGDGRRINNAVAWLVATCEPLKPEWRHVALCKTIKKGE